MLISVVIPVYNCINTLENTLDSILHSGLQDFEIILVEDGSTDGTDTLCDALQHRHSCLRCIHKDNEGVSQARNRGILEARGDYILFFDADDTVDAGALASCQELLRRQQPDMLLFGMSFDYYFHGRLYRRDELICPLAGLLPRKEWQAQIHRLYDCNALSPVWNKFIRKEILLNNQVRFPGGMIEMEDFLFSLRCLKHCESIYVLPEAIYRYRQPEDESNTYRRLCRIPSLSAYMVPFEEELASIPGGTEIAGQIYEAFFYEMIRSASLPLLARTGSDMLASKYAPRIEAKDPGLYRLLRERKYAPVRLRSLAMNIRHRLAVRVKYWRKGGKMQ